MPIDPLTGLYALAIVAVVGLTLVAASAPQRLWLRIGALSLAAVLLAVSFGGLIELLGRSKPTSLEWMRAQEDQATVLAHQMREGEAIFVWLQLESEDEPRAYALPWDEQKARELHEAAEAAKKSGTKVRMHRPFVHSTLRTEPIFHAEPQPAPPTKEVMRRLSRRP